MIEVGETIEVYPTRVGMNRVCPLWVGALPRIPHASGDEPHLIRRCKPLCPVYPTRVGMNRRDALQICPQLLYTPREWG